MLSNSQVKCRSACSIYRSCADSSDQGIFKSAAVDFGNGKEGHLKTAPDEIDLHGLTIDEAIPRVDEFLYRSFRAHVFRVWIIHGKGTGILRSAVKDYLTRHPLVLRCTVADGKRGGPGATQVDIKY